MTDDIARPDTLIVLSHDQASFYEFLKPRQEAQGGTLVILDRRRRDRRRGGNTPGGERRQRQRRTAHPDAALALMSVLGFMILRRDGHRWSS